MSLKLIHSVSERERTLQEVLKIVREHKEHYLEKSTKPEKKKIKWLRFGRAFGAKAIEDDLMKLLESNKA
jgi:hypothetical protein